jgi:hypothetical protein
MSLQPDEVEDFLDQCRVKLTGASDAGIKQELFHTLKEFFSNSRCWIENSHINVIANTQKYLLTPDDGGQIIGLVGVWDGWRVPVPASMEHFGELHVHMPVQITTIIPTTPGPHPLSQTNPWLVRWTENVVRPTDRDSIAICPDWTLRVYGEHILDGVLGRMMSQSNKSYSDATNGAYHLRRFIQGTTMARTAANRANIQGAQNWRYPLYAVPGTQRGGVSTPWPTLWR